MVDEVKPQTSEEKIEELEAQLSGLTFLTDIPRFNSIIYQGLQLILKNQNMLLQKVEEIEAKLSKTEVANGAK